MGGKNQFTAGSDGIVLERYDNIDDNNSQNNVKFNVIEPVEHPIAVVYY